MTVTSDRLDRDTTMRLEGASGDRAEARMSVKGTDLRELNELVQGEGQAHRHHTRQYAAGDHIATDHQTEPRIPKRPAAFDGE
jgi:hypothetical protein